MADDVVALMRALGFERFSLAGHDRGGARRLSARARPPEAVEKIAVLDIVPTAEMWRGMDAARAMQVYHWMFLAQPAAAAGNADCRRRAQAYIDHTLASWTATKSLDCFDGALPAYRAAFADPQRIHAMCEDYRAGATLDRAADEADFAAGPQDRGAAARALGRSRHSRRGRLAARHLAALGARRSRASRSKAGISCPKRRRRRRCRRSPVSSDMGIRMRSFVASLALAAAVASAAAQEAPKPVAGLEKINHIIVLYLENRSFDNLYGLFPGAEGVAGASEAASTQLDKDGKVFDKLPPVLNTNVPLPASDPRCQSTANKPQDKCYASAQVSGRLVAKSRTTTPSAITVEAGNNINVGKNAKLVTASRTGDAGDVTLKAGGTLTVASGANFNASSTVGNGGTVDLSSDGTFNIGNNLKVNVGAPNGKAGTLLVDPTNIVVGDLSLDSGVTMSNATVASLIAALSDGGTFSLVADNSITLDPHAVINTSRLSGGVSSGNPFNVDLDAPTITVMAGAQIVTAAVNTTGSGATSYAAGQILLNANGSSSGSITIAGSLIGGQTTLEAGSSITLSGNAIITTEAINPAATSNASTKYSVANSQDITLTAPTIVTSAQSKVLAGVVNANLSTYTPGTITFDATGSSAGTVTVAGTLAGGATTLKAGSSVTLSGTVDTQELNTSGTVSLYNSQNVTLTAPTISVASSAQIEANALNSAQPSPYSGGTVTLDATGATTGTVTMSGHLFAGATTLEAGSSVTLGGSAIINTQVLVGGSSVANSQNVTLTAPTINAQSGSQVVASAIGGFAAGTVLFDATGATSGSVTLAGSISGGETTLQAGASVTLAATAVIDTQLLNVGGTASVANSQDVSLVAPTVNTASGSQILANAVGTGFTGGSITLNANATTSGAVAAAGTLNGDSITILAGSTITVGVPATFDAVEAITLTAPTINVATTAGSGSATLSSGTNVNITASTALAFGSQAVIDATQTATLTSPTITVAGGAGFSAATVNYDIQQSTLIIGDATLDSADASILGSTFLANTVIAAYVAALGGSGKFELTASGDSTGLNTIVLDTHGTIDAGTAVNVALNAPTITLTGGGAGYIAGGSGNGYLRGHTIALDAGSTGTVTINVAKTGAVGLVTAPQSPLQIITGTLDLTTGAAAMIVGGSNTNAAGYVANSTITAYKAFLPSSGTLGLTSTTSIEITSGIVDATSVANFSIGAPIITLDGGAQIRGQSVTFGGGGPGSFATMNINAAISGGATISANSLQLSALQINLSGPAAMIVGSDGSANISTGTVSFYANALGGMACTRFS